MFSSFVSDSGFRIVGGVCIRGPESHLLWTDERNWLLWLESFGQPVRLRWPCVKRDRERNVIRLGLENDKKSKRKNNSFKCHINKKIVRIGRLCLLHGNRSDASNAYRCITFFYTECILRDKNMLNLIWLLWKIYTIFIYWLTCTYDVKIIKIIKKSFNVVTFLKAHYL